MIENTKVKLKMIKILTTIWTILNREKGPEIWDMALYIFYHIWCLLQNKNISTYQKVPKKKEATALEKL